MSRNRRVFTLDEVVQGIPTALNQCNDCNNNNIGRTVCHIPHLPNDDAALAILRRVCKEFEPIMKRRGYNVRSVSELCCCGDGLDYHDDANIGNTKNKKKKRRKLRKMADNVWGYNMTTTSSSSRYGKGKSHTIHLRLRHARSHRRLHLYEDVAGTMAHELAHCEYGAHNKQFYKLMDEILEEHMLLQSSSAAGFSLINSNNNNNNSTTDSNDRILNSSNGSNDVSNSSAKPAGFDLEGMKLGGDIQFTKWLKPAEAACMAAEARRRQQALRLRGDHCCKPCIVDISNDDDEEEQEDAATTRATKNSGKEGMSKKHRSNYTNSASLPASNNASTKRQKNNVKAGRLDGQSTITSPVVYILDEPSPIKMRKINTSIDKPIDLTLGYNISENNNHHTAIKIAASSNNNGSSSLWSCITCTYFNKPVALVCSMCQTERDLIS